MSLGSREALGAGSPPSLNVGHLFPTIVLADGRLRIPTELPPDPLCRPVRLEDLELDDELAESGATIEYTLASLRRMAALLVQSGSATQERDEPYVTHPACPYPLLRCTLPNLPAPQPTHTLDIHFLDTHEVYRTHVHGLVWALQSPRLPQLSKRWSSSSAGVAGEQTALLPVVTLELPHRPAWPLLHRYLYDGSPAQLLNNLLTTPTPLPPPTSSATPGGQALSAAQQRDLDSLLIRLMRVREVWLDAAALELSDVALWATLRRAWDVLVADLGELAADIPGSKIPGRNEEAV
ncbi:uncharacterized protein JCM10292_004360 [Rhodotorula paludigena]|uniref:uncharacterized protein n=1 Tax=Rhodotorula paludigena TaxID=86838 RepID=UPI0031787D4A